MSVQGTPLLDASEIDWTVIYNNYKTLYTKLSTREFSEGTVLGRTFKYQDLKTVLKLLNHAKRQAGLADRVPRILESY
jgi:hypothetical protein